MQFTRAGHTQLRGNAYLITSTITVVLFSTMVRHLNSCSTHLSKEGALIVHLHAGFWVDNETYGEILDALIETVEQISVLRASHTQVLHCPTSGRWSRFGVRPFRWKWTCIGKSWEWAVYNTSTQFTDAIQNPYSYRPLLLEKIRWFFHASRFWWPWLCSVCTGLSNWTKYTSMAGRRWQKLMVFHSTNLTISSQLF